MTLARHRDDLVLVDTYPYADEHGNHLYNVLRYEPKTFRQERPDGTRNLEGVRRVLYRLPQLVAAVEQGDEIYFVEGEKDVAAIEDAGAVGTCVSGGTNGWRPEFTRHFRGAVVTIVADRDQPGRDFAAKVAVALQPVAASVSIVEAQVGKDAADHLGAGYGLHQFIDVTTDLLEVTATSDEPPPSDDDDTIEPRPFAIVDLADHLQSGPTEPDYVPGPYAWLYAGRLTAIQAEPGVGKSWVALWLAIEAIRAGAAVLYMDEEGGPELITERLLTLGAGEAQIAHNLIYVPYPGRAWDLADQAALHQLLEQRPDVRLAVFDSLPDFLSLAGKSEDSAQDVTWWIDRVCGICRDHDVAQIVLDHLVKPDPTSASKTRSRYSRGSGAKLAKTDTTLLLETAVDYDAHTSGSLKLWKTKDRRGRLPLPGLASSPVILDIHVETGTIAITVRDPEPGAPTAQRHHRPTRLMQKLSEQLEKLNAAGIKVSTNQIHKAVKGNKATKDEALRCLVDENYVDIEAGPNRSILHVVKMPYREVTDPRSDRFATDLDTTGDALELDD